MRAPRSGPRQASTGQTTLVVTTVHAPTKALEETMRGVRAAGWKAWIVGDAKTPSDFRLEAASYLSLADQEGSGWRLATKLPRNHYARKNLGYLEAMASRPDRIVETDDDNAPLEGFFAPGHHTVPARLVRDKGWFNVYRSFSDSPIWPRGFPLRLIRDDQPFLSNTLEPVYCPIQQGLANGDPDVDAIHRLVHGGRFVFSDHPPVALAPGARCPINSQNTAWWPDAFALMYLPANCSFRLTDIWRGLVAQRITGSKGWHLLFTTATVEQVRHPHDLLDDFRQELDAYLRVQDFIDALDSVRLEESTVGEALLHCYRRLCSEGFFPSDELALVEAWLADVSDAIGD
jgi:hypothetical protein